MKKSGKSGGTLKFLLTVGMPVIFSFAFLCQQIISVDTLGWVNGFSHPLTGWDHLVTMLAVGIWAAQLRGQAVWMLPLAFVSVMSLGGIAGAGGLTVPSVEGIILLSCAVFGVLITRKVRFDAKINVMIVAFFAFFHGFAHGQEISASASLISYTLGFLLATLLLHGVGILVAKLVILTVTALIGVIFSTASIAGAWAPSSASKHMLSNDAKHQSDGTRFFGFPSQGVDTNRSAKIGLSSFIDDYHAEDGKTGWQRQKFKDSLGSVACIKSGHLSDASLQSFSKQFNDAWAYFELSASKVFSACVDLSPFETEPLLQIGFSSLYPSINNTPGMLLSNGVGLNSPPASALAVPLKLSNHFCSTPNSFSEDTCLQSIDFPLLDDKHYESLSQSSRASKLVVLGRSPTQVSSHRATPKVRLCSHSFPSVPSSASIFQHVDGNSIELHRGQFHLSSINKTLLNLPRRRKSA